MEHHSDMRIDSTSFALLTLFTIALSLEAAIAMPMPHVAGALGLIPVLFGAGPYLSSAATFFPNWRLYRMKAQQVVPFAGEENADLTCRLAGFATIGASVWMLSGL